VLATFAALQSEAIPECSESQRREAGRAVPESGQAAAIEARGVAVEQRERRRAAQWGGSWIVAASVARKRARGVADRDSRREAAFDCG
jgi:hypothetical protein